MFSPAVVKFLHSNNHTRYSIHSKQCTIHATLSILKHRPNIT